MNAADVTRVAVSLLRRDGGTQIRAQVSIDVAKDYAEAMGRGDTFPPVRARYDGTHYWLSDGFHRVMAADLIQQIAIDTEVRPGTRRDALLDAIGANASHGYRRTNADKRQAVLTLVNDEEWSKKSDRELARIAHVDPGMVSRLRPPPSVAEPQKRTVSRGGKTFEMDVGGINRERAAAPTPPPAPAPINGSVQLRTLLGELRTGADVQTAAVVAEIGIAEAREHALAEKRGEYSDLTAIEPNWKIESDTLILTLTSELDEGEASPSPAANDVDPEPAVEDEPIAFDFDAAQRRDVIMQAIRALADAPTPADFAAIWSQHVGRGVPDEIVPRAAAWMAAFATLFPEAEAARQRALATMLEKL